MTEIKFLIRMQASPFIVTIIEAVVELKRVHLIM